MIVHLHPADGAAGDQPVERGPRVVACHAGGVRSQAHRHAGLEHFRHRRRVAGGFDAVALGEVFALEGHAVLHGNAAAERFDAVDVGL